MFNIGNIGEIAGFVKNLDCPCSKDDVIRQAEESGMSESIINILEKLPDKVYSSADEIMQYVQSKV